MQMFVPTASGYVTRPLDRPMMIDRAGGLAPASDFQQRVSVAAWLVPSSNPQVVRRAVLLAENGAVRVNGRVPMPLTVLARGDELRVGSVSLFFTDEAPLQVQLYEHPTGSSQPASCSRCHRPLQLGEPVVYCPLCALPYMAQNDKNPSCWNFGPCLGCQRDPAVEFVWRPDQSQSVVPWHQRPGRRDGVPVFAGK